MIPNWYTTPSYGPVSTSSSTLMEVAADHPARQAFCGVCVGDPSADPTSACLADAPWYFHGRPFGNDGPARRVRRESRTQRVAASVDGDFTAGGRDAHWDVGVSYSRARGNFRVPGVYRDRIFRAFRGFGGPDSGVGVVDQYRGMQTDGDPNDSGDATLNPCDLGCPPGEQFGPYLFTGVHRPYMAEQHVQRLFGELALGIGPRLDAQVAANYEFYDVAGRRVNSFDPKLAARLQVAENLHYSLALRGSVQTTFRTPSLDDLNPSP